MIITDVDDIVGEPVSRVIIRDPEATSDDFVDLAFLVQDASVRSVVFDSSVIDPAYPDYDQIRQLVQDAIDPATAAPSGRTTAYSAPATEPSASPSRTIRFA